MLTKNCRTIIRAIRNQGGDDRYGSYSIQKLMDLTGLTVEPIIAACEQLALEGLMEITYFPFGRGNSIDDVRLTEPGANYGEVRSAQVQHYIVANWIAFLALVVAIISLIRTL